ncbi:MAG: hypothetical protein RIK87_05205 [Fuerstiella sp.]
MIRPTGGAESGAVAQNRIRAAVFRGSGGGGGYSLSSTPSVKIPGLADTGIPWGPNAGDVCRREAAES